MRLLSVVLVVLLLTISCQRWKKNVGETNFEEANPPYKQEVPAKKSNK
jgi:hypothetical protein